jgi:hypothetical protein
LSSMGQSDLLSNIHVHVKLQTPKTETTDSKYPQCADEPLTPLCKHGIYSLFTPLKCKNAFNFYLNILIYLCVIIYVRVMV